MTSFSGLGGEHVELRSKHEGASSNPNASYDDVPLSADYEVPQDFSIYDQTYYSRSAHTAEDREAFTRNVERIAKFVQEACQDDELNISTHAIVGIAIKINMRMYEAGKDINEENILKHIPNHTYH